MPDENKPIIVSVNDVDRGWLLGLANDLQRTLDVDELLRMFSQSAGQIVRHDHLLFESEDKTHHIDIGEQASHRCNYDVVLPELRLGSLSFSRATPFTEGEVRLLEKLMLHLIYPLRNALMYEAVVRASGKDALTGLGNRTTLEATLDREFAAANRHGEALSVIMLDVDHFKAVNDQHGHLAGDKVLRRVAGMISAEIRDCDIAFRYGGEEFIIVLAKTDLTGAILLAERVRKQAQTCETRVGDDRVQVTVSLGVTTLEQGDTQTSLIGRADIALYRSKSNGRNRVTSRTLLDASHEINAADPLEPARA
ncbi:MAG: diguanylate cyclase (GGDEF)-like protein [Gammaproteobacteria bacterium]|jgi:diguanylate cyclase (GGDEF)-like protein